MKKIVITGATGMIGASLVEVAIKNNMEVLCLINHHSTRIKNIPVHHKVKIIECSLSEYKNLSFKETQYDAFFHLAWEKTYGVSRDDVQCQLDNIQYTLDAVHLAHCLGCKAFIGTGSQAEYGIVSNTLYPDTPINPSSGYGIAKYTAGKLSRLLCSQLNMKYNWVRILSIYGEKDSSQTLISYCITSLLNNQKPQLTACEQIWDYLYCKDAAKALLAIAQSGIDKKAYVLGSGIGKPIKNYIDIIYKKTNANCGIGYGEKSYYPHQPMHLVADIEMLTKDTGWSPETTFEKGIEQTISWLALKDNIIHNR